MNKYQKFLAELRGEMLARGINQVKLSKDLGISKTSLSLFFTGKTASIDMINAVVKYLENYKEEK